LRPSAMARTTSDCPQCISPAANTQRRARIKRNQLIGVDRWLPQMAVAAKGPCRTIIAVCLKLLFRAGAF
jgi:hypothetical protein